MPIFDNTQYTQEPCINVEVGLPLGVCFLLCWSIVQWAVARFLRRRRRAQQGTQEETPEPGGGDLLVDVPKVQVGTHMRDPEEFPGMRQGHLTLV